MTAKWPKTNFLTLRMPSPAVLDFQDRVQEAVGDQVEVLGKNMRLVLPSDEVLVAGDLVALGAGEASNDMIASFADSIANGMVLAQSGSSVMLDMLALRGDSQESLSPGLGVVSGAAIERASPYGVEAVPIGANNTGTRTVQSQIGHAITASAMLVDGTQPLVVYPGFLTRQAFSLYPLRSVNGWDNSNKRTRIRTTIGPAETSDTHAIVWPIPIPANFGSFDIGDANPFQFKFRGQLSSGAVLANFIDSDGVEWPGTTQTGTTWHAYSFPYSLIASAAIRPRTICYLELEVTAAVAGWVEVESNAHVRYAPRRAY